MTGDAKHRLKFAALEVKPEFAYAASNVADSETRLVQSPNNSPNNKSITLFEAFGVSIKVQAAVTKNHCNSSETGNIAKALNYKCFL
jgi:hypothetical protein